MLLFFALFMFFLYRFQARRSAGYFMLFVYVMFVIYCLLGEFNVIHPYGTDHLNEGDAEY